MKILVGSTELTVNSCYAYRYSNGKLVLKIEVPQTEIVHDELKSLLKNNTEDIVKTSDDGTQETYSGFRYTLTILDRDDVYECEVECVSETERKVGDLQNTVSTQDSSIKSLKRFIAEQEEQIQTQSDIIAEQQETLLELYDYVVSMTV